MLSSASLRNTHGRFAGFTLIELLIVVAIIAILAAIAVPNFLEAQIRSKVSRCRTDMRALATALEAYFVDNNAYAFPSYGWSTNGDTHSTFDVDNEEQALYSMTGNLGLTTPVAYVASLPRDPFSNAGQHWFGYVSYKRGWILTSYGPDLDGPDTWNAGDIAEVEDFPERDFDPRLLLQKAYDSTNGSKSEGDLYRTNAAGDQ